MEAREKALELKNQIARGYNQTEEKLKHKKELTFKELFDKGYSLNKDKMLEGKIKELQLAIDLISNTLMSGGFVVGAGEGFIEIIKAYSKTWDLLIKYDEGRLLSPENLHATTEEIITYEYAVKSIKAFKSELGAEGLFGIERDEIFRGILGNLMPSCD